MRRAVEACEKDYRGGPVPRDLLRVQLRWSCHLRTAHAHRWYLSAWVCWWVMPRPSMRRAAWLFMGLTVVGLVAAW